MAPVRLPMLLALEGTCTAALLTHYLFRECYREFASLLFSIKARKTNSLERLVSQQFDFRGQVPGLHGFFAE